MNTLHHRITRAVRCLGLLSLGLLIACQASDNTRPDNLIPPDRMAAILTDVHMAESRVSRIGLRSVDSSNIVYKHLEKGIYQKFRVDTAVYTKSYIYYSSHPSEMEAVYKQVVENLKTKTQAKKTGPLMSIGIIGAGISGLTLAYELQRRGMDYHLWEATDQPGGYIQSIREAAGSRDTGYLRELGPNSILGDADLLNWIDGLGLTPELVFANPVSKDRYIFRNGQYRKLPSGPPSLLLSSFFSWQTKWAIFRERTNQTISPEGETLAQFFRRRFTNELVDYALAPFVAGIYAGDPERLLVSETFPVLLQYEREYGSVLRGLIKNQSASGRRQSFSFRQGMQTLPKALATQLTHLSLNDPVKRLVRDGNGWRVDSATGSQTVDRLVLCVGANAAARLVEPLYAEYADALRQIAYPPMTAVHSAYKRADVRHPLDGFGGLNPSVEGRFAAGHIWSSSAFNSASDPTRCPADEVLFTTFVGGASAPDNARQPDDVIYRRVHDELVESFGIRAANPNFRAIYRWERAIPQYDKAIVAVKPYVAAAEVDNLLVCANWSGGLSLSDCLQKARTLGARLADNVLINNF